MLVLAKMSVRSVGLLAQLMFAWTFPWSHAVPSRPVLSLASVLSRSSLRGKGSLEASLWRQRLLIFHRIPSLVLVSESELQACIGSY